MLKVFFIPNLTFFKSVIHTSLINKFPICSEIPKLVSNLGFTTIMAFRLPFLYVQKHPKKGRGVFTAQRIPAGSSIESCPVIILSPADTERVHETYLHDYYFLWGEDGSSAIALGWGSLYNHASQPSADYQMDIAHQSIDFVAIRDIEAGEEITVSYTDGGLQETTLWFEEE